MNAPAAVRFFHVWDTYAKVVAGNYMYHRELGDAVREALRERFGARPFSILDLGCGDAATFAPLLPGFSLTRYKGADLSQAALALAAQNLSGLSCPVELKQADFVEELAASAVFDVIYVSFALHHLTTQAKADFFQLAAQKLAPGGLLLMVDVVREEGQALEAYLSAYTGWLRKAFATLATEEHDAICEHIVNNDFPDSGSTLQSQGKAAGLRLIGSTTPQVWHRLLCFERN